MSRVITFSTTFPAGHPMQGTPTYFVEKIMSSLADKLPGWTMPNHFTAYDWITYYNCQTPKYHTVRKGNRWKVGDVFSPRIWSGAPYRSKQLCFSADLKIVEVHSIKFDGNSFFINGIKWENTAALAHCDGLYEPDFLSWFKEPFDGQIIAWLPIPYSVNN